jgi:hypothetical protein
MSGSFRPTGAGGSLAPAIPDMPVNRIVNNANAFIRSPPDKGFYSGTLIGVSMEPNKDFSLLAE